MLRNVTNIIMTCLLLISTTGFAVSKHYCGNELISIALKTEADPCCDDGMCCHTETQFLQLDNDFLVVATQTNLEHIYASDLILTASEVEISLPETNFFTSFNYSDPPPRCLGTRLALHQVFLL
ncbi:hypothetical protein BY457_12512 [Marinilabilia salmonicolor]|uniref:HYC_CC_PP family protein n=1 Tax=Marinilabilia salmonicolor TaxID=989 RepID=UPI000D07970B|nr:hypothetical protein [Marinilabilia salmonicolor]PRY91364.1 hypothetical protein BY457_12512 [Marinilabilia salmonicolor]